MSDLQRFTKAQKEDFNLALEEIRSGRKRSHWMWYIFPQIRGLGRIVMSIRYGLDSLEETRAYLAHPILGTRLLEAAKRC